jgi:hypothetical protein
VRHRWGERTWEDLGGVAPIQDNRFDLRLEASALWNFEQAIDIPKSASGL